MTLFRAGREIQLLYFGRGHTGGDVVVYLPKEKAVCTGDLFTGSIGYMGDGYLDEWVQALEELKKLDFEAVIPGHGEVIMGGALGKQRIGFVQAYFRELWAKANEMKAQGVSADDAAKRIDMTAHKGNFPQITAAGVDPRAVNRIYQVLDERAKK
jgi:glyoxylase-like metal-dependent hydrolase (beta-lactamase superfamily II)